MTKNILFATKIGSHVWEMNTEASDTDIFEVYVAPTEDILKGIANTRSKFIQKEGVDIAQHEVGKLIDQLLKGNLNFIIGVMSPLIIRWEWGYLADLRWLVRFHLAKNCYHSIHGLAYHNYKKYIWSGKDTSEKRCNKILRVLKFGQRILDGKGIVFEKVKNSSRAKIEEEMTVLDEAFENSTLPDKPTEEPFREWLYRVRLKEWDDVV